MPYDEKSRDRTIKYAKEHLKRVPLDLQKDQYKRVQDAAAATGESVNGYIKTAIERRLESGE